MPRAVRRSTTRRPTLPVPPSISVGAWLMLGPPAAAGPGARVIAPPGEPGQRSEDDALKPAGRERSLDLVLELLGEQGQIERPRDAAQHRAALLGEADGGLEELLHVQRRAHLDADERVTVADVREVVLLAGGDDDHLARPCHDPLAAHPEAHRALDDLEALLLLRVDVPATGDPPARGELEVDRQQLAARVRPGPSERDPLSAGRVLECLSCLRHARSDLVVECDTSSFARQRTVYD